jgi:hypothetical protein
MRGKRSTKTDPLNDRDRQDVRRILQKVGLERYIQLGKEEIAQPPPDDFDNAVLPGLVFMEEQLWKYQRSREAKRIFKQRTLKLRQQEKDSAKHIKGRINYPFTREEHIRHFIVEPAWKHRKELGLGSGDPTNVVKRLVRKLRDRMRLRDQEIKRRPETMIAQIAKLKEIRVERGATHHEAATAVRKLTQLRQKLRESRYKVRN